MPVIDFILDALGVIENVFSASIVAILTYMIMGGWQFVFRAVSFFFDTQLVKLIGTVYSYFEKLITLDMFNEKLVDELMRNVYVFIGVIMFFRLMMLIIKYLINPDMIGDAKVGINSLIQRVILGAAGILFIPTIFNLANDLQVAILNDGIIQQLIIPRDMIDSMEDKIDKGGNYIGTYVLAGFLSPNSSASTYDKKQFDLGVQQGDLSNVDINDGGFLTQKFKYDYFFFISTLALGYVFYYILKYCIDIAGRCFRLLLYKMMAPIAMIEYMINGSQDGVFKQWLSASISTYCMLFVRILAIWFVMLVTTLMGEDTGGYAGSLLTDNDYFLRAIIIIALLGFMMDLPKLIGQLFGLDLEQEGSAAGVLKQVGGMVKGAAIGGLAIGGAAAGGLIGSANSFAQARREGKAEAKAAAHTFTDANGNQLKGQDLKDRIRQEGHANTAQNIKNMNHSGQLKALSGGILSAAMGSNQFTGAFSNSFNNNQKAQEQVGNNAMASAISKQKEKDSTAEDKATMKSIKDSNEALKADIEAVLKVNDRDASGTVVNAELRTTTAPTMDVDARVNMPSTSGSIDLSANVDTRTSSTISQAVTSIDAMPSSEVTLNGKETGVSERQIDSNVQVIAQEASTQVFNGTAAQNTMQIRQELVNNNQVAAVNNFSEAENITSVSNVAASQIGVDEKDFNGRLNVALEDMARNNSSFDRSNVSIDDAMRAVETVIQGYHQEVQNNVISNPEVQTAIDRKKTEARNI